jgi:hypothetical protein
VGFLDPVRPYRKCFHPSNSKLVAPERAPALDFSLIFSRATVSEIQYAMDSHAAGTGSTPTAPISQHMVGPPCLRQYATYELITWQPQGRLDDAMLDRIAEWLVNIEKVSLPFKRFVDFSQLTTIAIRTRHVFEFARERAEQFAGTVAVRTALYCDDWVGFGIARLYESLMENTHIEARAFQDLNRAAEWLGIPADVLTLDDEPAPPTGSRT